MLSWENTLVCAKNFVVATQHALGKGSADGCWLHTRVNRETLCKVAGGRRSWWPSKTPWICPHFLFPTDMKQGRRNSLGSCCRCTHMPVPPHKPTEPFLVERRGQEAWSKLFKELGLPTPTIRAAVTQFVSFEEGNCLDNQQINHPASSSSTLLRSPTLQDSGNGSSPGCA